LRFTQSGLGWKCPDRVLNHPEQKEMSAFSPLNSLIFSHLKEYECPDCVPIQHGA
jgi:hypothetical protein